MLRSKTLWLAAFRAGGLVGASCSWRLWAALVSGAHDPGRHVGLSWQL